VNRSDRIRVRCSICGKNCLGYPTPNGRWCVGAHKSKPGQPADALGNCTGHRYDDHLPIVARDHEVAA